VEGALPEVPRFVMIMAPHTSNWDWPICMLAMFATGLRITWLAKHSLFFFPVAPVLRWLGGEPVDRSAPQGLVGTAIRIFEERPSWVVGITPEGTRKAAPGWKTGFHRIAIGAGVPIFPIWVDYRRRVLGLGTLYYPTGDLATDVAALGKSYDAGMARYPENFAPPIPLPSRDTGEHRLPPKQT